MAGVFWTGADGNVYGKGSDFTGVKNFGGGREFVSGVGQYGGYTQISDPSRQLAGDPAANNDPTGLYGQVDMPGGAGVPAGSGGSAYDPAAARAAAEAAAKRAANDAARGNTQKAIDSLGTELNVGYGNIDAEAGSVRGRYDLEASSNEGDYNTQTVNNNQNLLKNKQNGLQAGAQGARGLRGTLASIGALGGDGIKLANRAVTASVNQDLGEASETAATNARTLDGAIGKFRDEDKLRRAELETQARNQKTALEGRVESKRQGYFQKMAELFSEIGDAGNATSFLNRAGDLNNTIAQKTAVAATPISAKGAAFTPGSLADYLAGNGDMTVQTAEGDMTGMGTSPSSILAGRKDEKRKQTAVLA